MAFARWCAVAFAWIGAVSLAADPVAHDAMAAANEASLIAVQRAGLVSGEAARGIACELDRINHTGVGRQRSTPNYLDVERALIEVLGPDGNAVHLGRSRQDLHETVRRMTLRTRLLKALDSHQALRRALLELAERYANSVVPAYTHGVQAQPTTLGHQLLAYASAFERDARRLRAAYDGINLSPLGSAALATSAFELDRDLLAALLGFHRPIANSFDANLIASLDHKTELASALSTSALIVGQWAEGVHRQYQHARPWLLLDANSTSRSSLMPQKANPRPLDRLRLTASETVANAHRVALVAHNLPAGMHDYRDLDALLATLASAEEAWSRMAELLAGLRLDEARALAEVDAEYATSTALAEWLTLQGDVPLASAYRAASELTKRARRLGVPWSGLSDEILLEVIEGATGQQLASSVDALRSALDAEAMVRSRVGQGGPQPASIQRLLADAVQALQDDQGWLTDAVASQRRADADRSKMLRPLLARCNR